MKPYTVCIISLMMFLTGCSQVIPNNETVPETIAQGDEFIIFDTQLPLMKIDDMEFAIGKRPTDDMLSYISPFYKNHEQYHVDLDTTLQAANAWKTYMDNFDESLADMQAELETEVTEESPTGETEEAIIESPDISEDELKNVATRIIFGGQQDDGSYLSFSVSNLGTKATVASNCIVTNTSVIYGDSLGKITYNDKEVKTRKDMESLMGTEYSIKDATEYDYIYDSMCVYTIDGYMTMSFLMHGDDVVGVQQADLGEYANLFDRRE